MDWKLEVVVVPVSNVDRAKNFYADQIGFHVDVDTRVGEHARVVQLTPPGSACSVSFVSGSGNDDMVPSWIKGLQLVVANIQEARAQLAQKGVDVSPIRHVDNGVWFDGTGEPGSSFIFFSDPDANSWTVQEKPE